MGLASINAVEVPSKQTSTDLNATHKHANGSRLPSRNKWTLRLGANDESKYKSGPNSSLVEWRFCVNTTNCLCKCARRTDIRAVIFYPHELGRVLNGSLWDLHLNWKPTGQSFSNCRCKLTRTSKEAEAEATPGENVKQRQKQKEKE